MADSQHQPNPLVNSYLSPNQQDLLFAALNSQAADKAKPHSPLDVRRTTKRSESDTAPQSRTMSASEANALFISPQDAELDDFGADYTPDLDYLDGGDNFDFENADLGGDMIGALPGTGDGHEKRKSPDESEEGEENAAKRQETQDGEKGAKKPGRKPLTSEPTTKRKAQNRAAQRAFRERKEKHLKDLETKVSELTKSSEADKHENGLLKAQVERLQTELREYRKRLSLNGTSASRSPPLSASRGQSGVNGTQSYGNSFQFDFPKFGTLPGSLQMLGKQNGENLSGPAKRGSMTPPMSQSPTTMAGFGQPPQAQVGRQNSMNRSLSPTDNQGQSSHTGSPAQAGTLDSSFAAYSTTNNMHGFAATLPQMNGTADPFGGLFSPNLLKTAGVNGFFNNTASDHTAPNESQVSNADNGNDSTSGLNRVFQFNGGSVSSDTTSPSASSSSQWNANGASNSSCGTSPEPSHDSPAIKDKTAEGCNANVGAQKQGHSSFAAEGGQQATTGLDATFGLPDYNVPSLAGFDPVLFGDYRDSSAAIVGGGDFAGGFFDDALNQNAPFDYGSPSNLFGILQSPQQSQATLTANHSAANAPTPSRSLMAEIEKTRDGCDDDYGLANVQPKKLTEDGKLISCNNIWTQLQSNPDFQEGKFDLDNLCSELKAKARCSESGMMVDQDSVDAALRKLGKKPDPTTPSLLFDRESWDNYVKKQANRQR